MKRDWSAERASGEAASAKVLGQEHKPGQLKLKEPQECDRGSGNLGLDHSEPGRTW